MTRPMRYLLLAVVLAPVLTYVFYRLARGLGFLDPPWNKEHEQRRIIVAALFAFLLFFPIFLFGFANEWPRVWALFGVIDGLALVGFGAAGTVAAVRLWKLRHSAAPPAAVPPPEALAAGDASEKPLV